MTIQLATPPARAWRLPVTDWFGGILQRVASAAASISSPQIKVRTAVAKNVAISTPRPVCRIAVPSRPTGTATHMPKLAAILDRQIERSEAISQVHHRASQMLGSIDYELQCLAKDLAAVTRNAPIDRARAH